MFRRSGPRQASASSRPRVDLSKTRSALGLAGAHFLLDFAIFMQIHRAKNKNTLRPVGLWVGCGGIMGNTFLIHVVRRSICIGLLTVGCLAVPQAGSLAKEPAPAAAPPKEVRTESSLGERMNANTVSVI